MKTYYFENGFKGKECPKLYKQIKCTNYKPALFVKQTLDQQIGTLIKYIIIDVPRWKQMQAYFKRYTIFLAYGFYDPSSNSIFINLNNCGIKVDRHCHITTNPTTTTLRKLSTIIVHEFLHYLFQTYTDDVLAIIKTELYNFYLNIWKNVVSNEILTYITKAHFYIAISVDKNVVDPVLGRVTQMQLRRFLSILSKIKTNYNKYIHNKELFTSIEKYIEDILFNSTISENRNLDKVIELTYKKLFEKEPPNYLQVGQELIFASEILAVLANINSSKSLNIIRRVINSVHVL